MVVTIDGYCSQGKSFIGKALAKELNMEFFSTGNLVRYIAYLYTKLRDENSDYRTLLEKAVEIMKKTEIQEIETCKYLKTEETECAMKIAAEYPYVFEEVVKVIALYAEHKNIILDGRFTFDIVPDAERKYYFRSSFERRVELSVRAKNISRAEAISYIQFRDSFEKKYDIPECVKVINMDSFDRAEDLIEYLKNDIIREGDGYE